MLEAMLRDDFDLDLGLEDASLDRAVAPTRRMIAAASLGLGVNDAFYAARELADAVRWVHEGVPGGKARLTAILANRCDDYQRCLYFCLAGRGVVAMLDDLDWLVAALRTRGDLARDQRRRRLSVARSDSPYVAAEADGPVCAIEEFAEGASWSADRLPR